MPWSSGSPCSSSPAKRNAGTEHGEELWDRPADQGALAGEIEAHLTDVVTVVVVAHEGKGCTWQGVVKAALKRAAVIMPPSGCSKHDKRRTV